GLIGQIGPEQIIVGQRIIGRKIHLELFVIGGMVKVKIGRGPIKIKIPGKYRGLFIIPTAKQKLGVFTAARNGAMYIGYFRGTSYKYLLPIRFPVSVPCAIKVVITGGGYGTVIGKGLTAHFQIFLSVQ